VTVLSGANASVLYKVFGDQANDTFGHSVRGVAGDLDDDGTVDFIVGAPQLSARRRLRPHDLRRARKHALHLPRAQQRPNTRSDYGSAVCGGDFDGDGRTDVLIGGSNFNGGDGVAETWITAVASWQNYGSGWLGTNGVPGLTAQNDPVSEVAHARPRQFGGGHGPGLLVLGLGKANLRPAKGGRSSSCVPVHSALDPGRRLDAVGPGPNDPSLYGFDLYLQALELDRGASNGLSFTRASTLLRLPLSRPRASSFPASHSCHDGCTNVARHCMFQYRKVLHDWKTILEIDWIACLPEPRGGSAGA